MAIPSVTYTFAAGTTAQSSQVNTNFGDIISALTDGTKNLTVAAISLSSFTNTGNTTLGNASGDITRVNGSFDVYGDNNTIGLDISTLNLVTIGASGGTQAHVVNGSLSSTLSNSAASFIPSGSTVPTNGVYLPAANVVGVSSNSTAIMRMFSSGGPNLRLEASATGTAFIYPSINDGLFSVSGGTAANVGSNILLYGGAHGSTPSRIQIRQAGTAVMDVAASTGLITLGASGSTVNHVVNGNLNIVAQGELRLQDTTGGQYVGLRASGTQTTTTLTLPDAAPAVNSVLKAGPVTATNLIWGTPTVSNVASSDATLTAADLQVYVTTGAANRTINLPAAATSSGVEFKITKVDTGAGYVLIDPNAAELIQGYSKITLHLEGEGVTISCDGTGWFITGYQHSKTAAWTPSFGAASGTYTTVTGSQQWWKSGIGEVSLFLRATGTTSIITTSLTFTYPLASSMPTSSPTLYLPFGFRGEVNQEALVIQHDSTTVASVIMTEGTTWTVGSGRTMSGLTKYLIDPAA